MYRFTTPTITLNLTLNDVFTQETLASSQVYVTITQCKDILTITNDDLSISDNQVMFTLTQEQSAKFYPGKAQIQVRGVTSDNWAWATKVATIDVENTLLKKVLDYEV